ncbi:hypothetical protein MMC27_008347 [Xylographa pallens]|nr:hypothetical protein [Xylographa pallens]
MTEQNYNAKIPETMDASQADEAQTHSEPAQAETETEPSEQSGPDFRAHVRVKPNPSMRMTLYDKGQQVYLKMARGLQGPFIVRKVNSDGTYQLETEAGKLFRDGAKERDLQPL